MGDYTVIQGYLRGKCDIKKTIILCCIIIIHCFHPFQSHADSLLKNGCLFWTCDFSPWRAQAVRMRGFSVLHLRKTIALSDHSDRIAFPYSRSHRATSTCFFPPDRQTWGSLNKGKFETLLSV